MQQVFVMSRGTLQHAFRTDFDNNYMVFGFSVGEAIVIVALAILTHCHSVTDGYTECNY